MLQTFVLLFQAMQAFLKHDRALLSLQDLQRTHIDLSTQFEFRLLVLNELIIEIHQDSCTCNKLRMDDTLPVEEGSEAHQLLLSFFLQPNDVGLLAFFIFPDHLVSLHLQFANIARDFFNLSFKSLAFDLLLLDELDKGRFVNLGEPLLNFLQGQRVILGPALLNSRNLSFQELLFFLSFGYLFL